MHFTSSLVLFGSMASTILSSITQILHNLSSFPTESSNDLNLIEDILVGVRSFLIDAEEQVRSSDECFADWMMDLKTAVYDLEDVVDELAFELLQSKEEVCDSITSYAFRIKALREIMVELLDKKDSFGFKECDHRRHLDSVLSPPIDMNFYSSVIFGRQDEKSDLIGMLLSEGSDNICVIPIVGVAGVGKTTVAETVYNDPSVSEHFELQGWVRMSGDFDEGRLIRAIIESVTKATCHYYDLNILQEELEYHLRGKMFLIVLDDFVEENRRIWESLRAQLDVGLKGSKVVLISQHQSVVGSPVYRLECLPFESSCLLFQSHAFDSQPNNFNPSFVSIGEKIIAKCKGLPLSVKMLGALLRFETDEDRWNSVLNSDKRSSDRMNYDALSAIRLSYSALPSKLQVCLLYCSVFPRGYMFKMDWLVRLWIAQGFIHSFEGKIAEEIGNEYFGELFRRSFFQCSDVDQHTFVMHDLIHQLARSITGKEFYSLDTKNLDNFPLETRHLSLVPKHREDVVEFKTSTSVKALRTLLVINKFLVMKPKFDWEFHNYFYNYLLNVSIPNDLFLLFDCLRVLDLSDLHLENLPDSIGNLKHLRFLGLNRTKIRRLPESVCELNHLHTLELQECNDLRELPKAMAKLTSLHHLDLPRSVRFILLPRGIGRLTRIQTLPVFYVGRNIENYVITELKDMVNLKGELHMSGLHNVLNVEDAKEANLVSKQHIEKLTLEWSQKYDDYNCEGIHTWHCGGREDFMIHGIQVDENEVKPVLQGEQNADEVDSLADDLWIYKLDMGDMPIDPKKARKKTIWKNRKIPSLQDSVLESLEPHKNIKELVVLYYKGTSFPGWLGDPFFTKLVSVTINACYNCSVLPPLGQLPLLKSLCIGDIVKVKHISYEFYGHQSETGVAFPSLESLELQRLPKLEGWLGVGLHQLLSLRRLKICHCPKLQFSNDEQLPPRLEYLNIFACSLLMKWCNNHKDDKLAHVSQVIFNKNDHHHDY